MKTVGIIANAYSGKDIRRLVAPASVFNDQEKINILKRLLLALNALDVERVLLMPDPLGLSRRALYDLDGKLDRLHGVILDLPHLAGDYRDSLRAAEAMTENDCGCIITLGGDGTNRIVSKVIGDTPLLPISAGTNNVFPYRIESTIAGLAAAAFARGIAVAGDCCRRMPLLELHRDGRLVDTALVDVVVVDQYQVGARAVWDPGVIRELYLTRARPADIGLAAIGGCLQPMPLDSGMGMHIRTGQNGRQVTAPIAPGLIHTIGVADYRLFGPDENMRVGSGSCVIALDGEREVHVDVGDVMEVKLNLHGPRIVDLDKTLNAAVANGFLAPPPD
jgi:predicted polyphosphate/ATP-dependent NAD kinase